jgi:HD-GYP domain-containing protein (c-di-GMP phosphodiesterase class II)
MKSIALKDLKPKGFYTKPVWLDRGFILLAPEVQANPELANRLATWEFREVFTDGDPVDNVVDTSIEDGGEKEGLIVSEGATDRERLEAVRTFLVGYIEYVDNLYNRFVTNSELRYNDLVERMRQICELLAENRRFILRALSLVEAHKNYLISHAVNTSIISMLLGSTLKMPLPRLMELGASAVLHEIGMVKLPPNLFMTSRQLSPEERRRITAHTILGFNILKEKQVPLSVQLATLEHHERMNGSGYPRAMGGDQISLYAKIIMVACSYDAVTMARPFREGRESHEGILDLLRNEGKQYDDLIIRAMVLTLSIYPIGSLVMLTNGKKALVIDTNPENPRFPIVQVTGATNPDGTEVKLRTSETTVRILRSLTKAEVAESRSSE